MAGNKHMSTRRLLLVILAFGIFVVKVTGQKCQAKVDIVILLDSSGSVGIENFEKLKQFLVNSTIGFTVGPNSIQIGLVTFSPPQTHFSLNTFSSSSEVQNGINNVTYKGGGTNTHVALRYVGSNSFKTSVGDRSNTPDLLVVIIDGHSSNIHNSKQEADILKQRQIKIMAIGIGSNVNRNELLGMASDSSYVFEVKDFDALSRFTNLIHSKSCEAELPGVHVSLFQYTTKYGEPVTMECKVISSKYPILEVFWEKIDNGITTRIDKKTSGIEGVTITNPSLTIKKPMVNSTYICKARNTLGTQNSTKVRLIVIGGPPTIIVQSSRYSTIYGSPVVLNCTVHSAVALRAVYWKVFYDHSKDSPRFIHAGDLFTAGITIENPSLSLQSPVNDDSGEYFCYARNNAGSNMSTAISLKVNGGVPEVQIGSIMYTVNYGQTVTLKCTVVSSPPYLEVYWEKKSKFSNGETIIRNGELGTSGSTTNNPSLTINTARISDQGNYVCVAKNMAGTGKSSEIVLNVRGGVPQVRINSRNHSSIFADQITLNCSVQSAPPHSSVYWQYSKDGKKQININNNATGTQGMTLQNPSLTIMSTNFADTGFYTCFASNKIGHGKSEVTYLKVIGDIPSVTTSKLEYTVEYGREVAFDCKINATPLHSEIYWRKYVNSTILRKISSSSPIISITPNGSTLRIKQVTSNDATQYRCVAVNAVGEGQSSMVTLTVRGGVPIVKRTHKKYKTGKGYSVTINCIVKSEILEVQSVSWKVFNFRINKTNVIRNGEVGIDGVDVDHPSLIINDVSVSMQGEYRCCATNIAGETCGLPSDLIVEPQFDPSPGESEIEDENKVDIIETVVAIIGSIITIVTALLGAFCFVRKRICSTNTSDTGYRTNEDKTCCFPTFVNKNEWELM